MSDIQRAASPASNRRLTRAPLPSAPFRPE
jgi:hypothetical protein